MPTTYAHKKFGAMVYKNLSESVRTVIAGNYPFFLAGLHGPDVLFFHKPGLNTEVAEIGRRVHKKSFAEFYVRGSAEISMKPNGKRIAYFIGCICHFMLDSLEHPLVHICMEETGMSHGKVELELDRYVLEKDGNRPMKYPAYAHIPVSMDVAREASDFYEGISPEDFLLSLTTMKAVLMSCGTNSDSVRGVLVKIMEKTGNEEKIASLIMSRQKSEMARKHIVNMYKAMADEAVAAASLIDELIVPKDGIRFYDVPDRFKYDFNGK